MQARSRMRTIVPSVLSLWIVALLA